MSLTIIDNEDLLNNSIKYENYNKNNFIVKENVSVDIGFRRKIDEQLPDDYSMKKIPRYNEDTSTCPVILSGAQCGNSYLFDCENHRENVVELIPLDEKSLIASANETTTISDSQKSCNIVPNRSSADDDICMDSCIDYSCVADKHTTTPASQRVHSESQSTTKEVNLDSTMSYNLVPCVSIVSLDNATASSSPRSADSPIQPTIPTRDSPIKPIIPTKVSDNSLVACNKTQNGEYKNNNYIIGEQGKYNKTTNATNFQPTDEVIPVLQAGGTEESVCSNPVSDLTRSSSLATFSSVCHSRHRHRHYGYSRKYKEYSSRSSSYRHSHHTEEDHHRRSYTSSSKSRSRSRSSNTYSSKNSQRYSKPHYSSSCSYYKPRSSSGLAAAVTSDGKYSRDTDRYNRRHYTSGERVSYHRSTYSRCDRRSVRSRSRSPLSMTTSTATDVYHTDMLIERKYGHRDLPLEWWERTEDCKDAKALHTERVDSICDSREELVLKTTLWKENTVLEPNMFPYWTPKGVEHYTLWSIHELQHHQIVKVVDKWLHKHMPHVKRWQYDDNAGERSINLFHVHVFLETIPYSFTPKPELEYFPPHVQLVPV